MKWYKILLSLLVLLPSLFYILLFTSIGNTVLTPLVKSKIDERLHVDSSINDFILDTNNFSLDFNLSTHNTILVVGNYDYFKKEFTLAYRVKFLNPLELEELLTQRLDTEILTEGNAKGSTKNFTIIGSSDVASSDTNYTLHVKREKLIQVDANISHIQSDKLLAMFEQVAYIHGAIDADISLKTENIDNPIGTITYKLAQGEVDTKQMLKDFNISLEKTPFSSEASIILGIERSKVLSRFDSDFAQIKINALINEEEEIEASSQINIQNLALLEPIVKHPLRGSIDINASLHGNKRNATLYIDTNIADSQTDIEAHLRMMELNTLKINSKHLHVDKLLTMLQQQNYLNSGIADSTIMIDDAENLSGSISLIVNNLSLNTAFIEDTYHLQNMPDITYTLTSHTTLLKDHALSSLHLQSPLFIFNTQKSSYIYENGLIDSDFSIKKLDLAALYFITDRELQTYIDLDGVVEYDDTIHVDAHSYFCDGELNIKLEDRDLRIKSKNLDSLKLLHVLTYPEYFQSVVNANFDYNLRTRVGEINAKLQEGRFTSNSIFDAVKNYTQADLYKERFEGTIHSNIESDILISNVELNSKNTSLLTHDSYLNTRTKKTNTKIRVTANNNPISFELKGDLKKPAITIDASELIEKGLSEDIGNFIDSLFK